jgi:hypothetical protein
MVARTAHITTLKGNARMFLNLREKNMAKFDAFPRRASGPGSAIRVQIFLPEVFFITERKKTHYCNLLYNFLFLIKFCKLN